MIISKMANQQEWHGPARIRTDPPNQESAAAPYVRRGRVLLGQMYGTPRKVEHQEDGTVITVMDRFKGEKLIHIALVPPIATVGGDFWGLVVTPTDTGARYGYTASGTTTSIPWKTEDTTDFNPEVRIPVLTNESLMFMDPDRNLIDKVERQAEFKETLDLDPDPVFGHQPIMVGTHNSPELIHWNCSLYFYAFGEAKVIDHGALATARNYPKGCVSAIGVESNSRSILFKMAGGEQTKADAIEASRVGYPLDLYSLAYRGKMLDMPEAPHLEEDVSGFTIMRYAGAKLVGTTLLFVRSKSWIRDAVEHFPIVAEEFCRVSVVIEENLITVNKESLEVLGTITYTEPEELVDLGLNVNGWTFNEDGTEAKSAKAWVPNPSEAHQQGQEVTATIDLDENTISFTKASVPGILSVGYRYDGTVDRLIWTGTQYTTSFATINELDEGDLSPGVESAYIAIAYVNLEVGRLFYYEVRRVAGDITYYIKAKGFWTHIGQVTSAEPNQWTKDEEGAMNEDVSLTMPSPILTKLVEDEQVDYLVSHYSAVGPDLRETSATGPENGQVYNNRSDFLAAFGIGEKSLPALNPIFWI